MSDAHVDTSDLISKARNRDMAAIEELLLRFRPDVWRWIDKECGRRASRFVENSDVAQEALVCIFRELDRYRGSTDQEFRAWARRISLNRLRDAIRHAGAQKRNAASNRSLDQTDKDGNAIGDSMAAPLSTPSMKIRSKELLERALGNLDVHEQQVIRLHRIGDKSLDEVAEILSITPEEATALLDRGLRKLSRFLRNDTSEALL